VGSLVVTYKLILAYRHNSVRHTHMTEDLRTAITRLQEDVKRALANADRQLVLLDDKKEDVDRDDDEEEWKPEKLQLLEERLKAMEASHRLLEELLSQAQEDMIAKAAAEDKSNSSTKSAVVHGDQVSGMKVVGTISGGTYSWGK
jgi:CRISPR/Cas system CMR subunit Cmr4 (Cas7 group RAMP superfamily)